MKTSRAIRVRSSPVASRSLSSTATAIASKYVRHRVIAKVTPSSAPTRSRQSIALWETAVPTLTRDSPIAMMMTNPWRSAKWPGARMRHPLAAPTYTPT